MVEHFTEHSNSKAVQMDPKMSLSAKSRDTAAINTNENDVQVTFESCTAIEQQFHRFGAVVLRGEHQW